MTRSRISFDAGWTFHFGDDLPTPRRIIAKHGSANGFTDLTEEERIENDVPKTGVEHMGPVGQVVQTRPLSARDLFSDVHLPHDWRIQMMPSNKAPDRVDYPYKWQGFFPTGIAYYRKVFKLGPPPTGEHVTLTFDGIGGSSDVWLNGCWLASESTSYTPLVIEITELLRPEGLNVLLIRSDQRDAEGWWYEGGGLYKHVWLDTFNDVHIPPGGIYVTTPEIHQQEARVRIEIEVANYGADNASITANANIFTTGKTQALEQSSLVSVRGCSETTLVLETTIQHPVLWQLGAGHLYTCEVKLRDSSSHAVLDKLNCTFGIRKVEFVQDGIEVNGIWTKIQGVNLHQDFGVYGVALPDRIIEYKLELCAGMGVNAIRSAHHPPTTELLEHADRLGMLVLSEHRLLLSTTTQHERLRVMIRQSRNHPSVFLYSLGNEEISMESDAVGARSLTRLADICHALDPATRTIYGGVSNLEGAIHGVTDVQGMHYQCTLNGVDEATLVHPEKSHVLDEEGLFASTRGVYHYDRRAPYSGSFSKIFEQLGDVDTPMDFGAIAVGDAKPCEHINVNMTRAFDHPRVSGAFVWTGIDYWGEPTPLRWPAIIASYGAFDIMGLPKDYFWLLRSIFRPEKPIVHAFPHWTWDEGTSESIPFRAYSNCEEVEFLVNDKPVTRRLHVKNHMVEVEGGLEYEAGVLVARGYRQGKLVVTHRQCTAGRAARIRLIPDRTTLSTSNEDVCVIRIAIIDSQGVLVPSAANRVDFKLSGNGKIAGAHNGNPNFDYENWDAKESINVFRGQAGIILEPSGKGEGDLSLEVSSSGLEIGKVVIRMDPEEPLHTVHCVPDEGAITGEYIIERD